MINREAGASRDNGDIERRLREAFAALGFQAQCRLLTPAGIGEAVRTHVRKGERVVWVAGGDGTLSLAANALAHTDTALAPLPMGTLNHFTRDLGIPQKLEEAVQSLASGSMDTIDLGDVNGRIFLNNASVGLYTRMVRWREALRARRPMNKRLATLYAMAWLALRLPRYRLFLEIDGGGPEDLCVPLLFVGNNRYAEQPLGLTSRQRLDAGKLHLAYPQGSDHKAVLRLLLSALLRPLTQGPEPVDRDVQKFRLHARRRRLTVALDGELHRLAQPLEFRVHRAALRVVLPSSG